MSVRTVRIPAFSGPRRFDATTVHLHPDGEDRWRVEHDGRPIGYVAKGHRDYSPPTHKGSRIVKYHKQVPEWHGGRERHHRREFRKDSRREVIACLLVAAAGEDTTYTIWFGS